MTQKRLRILVTQNRNKFDSHSPFKALKVEDDKEAEDKNKNVNFSSIGKIEIAFHLFSRCYHNR